MGDEARHLVGACGLRAPSAPVPDAGLGGLVPRPEGVVFGKFSVVFFVSHYFRVFCAHEPRMRIDDLSASTGRFFDRLRAFVTAGDRRPGRATVLSCRQYRLQLGFRCVVREDPSRLLRQRTFGRMPTPLGSLIRPPPPLRLQVLRPHRCLRILVRCRLRAAFPVECSDEQPLLQLPTEYGLGPSGASR